LTFQDAQLRLLAYVRDRIHNGELTERGFARMLGVSQPHVHNVLKGVRTLSIDLSDSILNLFSNRSLLFLQR
jgi:plasmid maintenance system antidote protein VapI